MSLLGLDIGTTGTKAVLFSELGRIVGFDYQEYPHIYSKLGWVELNPEKVWEAVKKTIRQVATKNKTSIRALCISCMGDNIIPVRNDGTPNYNGILAFDHRAAEEFRIISTAIGREKYFQTMGSPLSTISNLCKILWLKRNQRDVFGGTWKFMMFADYVLFRMGFPPQISYSMASLNIFDIKRKKYPEEMLKEFGLNGSMFSDLVPPDYIIGDVPFSVCSQLGLSKGVKVIAGGIDLAFGVLGAGVSPVTPGIVADVAGTFEHAAYVTNKPTLGKLAFEENVLCFCNVVKDSYVVFRGLPTAGAAVKWFRDEFAHEEKEQAAKEGKNVYDIMIEPLRFNGGNIIMHPYFAGHYGDSSARASIQGITLATKRSDILAGLVEGITHEFRINIEIIESIVKRRLDMVRTVGGLSRSKKLLQLKADLTGRTIETVSIQEASALGAALLAGVAIGVYNSIEDAIGNIVKVTERFAPRHELFEIYNRQHDVYKKFARNIHY
jgi:xylulokinase